MCLCAYVLMCLCAYVLMSKNKPYVLLSKNKTSRLCESQEVCV